MELRICSSGRALKLRFAKKSSFHDINKSTRTLDRDCYFDPDRSISEYVSHD